MSTHEQERLAALHEHRLLDAPAGDEVEAVVRVAGVPFATLNLIDENRQRIDRLKDLAQVILALCERRRQARANAELAGRHAELREAPATADVPVGRP